MAHVGDDGCDYSAWRIFHTVLGVTSLICLLVALYVYIAIKEYSSMTGKIVFVNIVTTALVMIWFIIVFNRPNIRQKIYDEINKVSINKSLFTKHSCNIVGKCRPF